MWTCDITKGLRNCYNPLPLIFCKVLRLKVSATVFVLTGLSSAEVIQSERVYFITTYAELVLNKPIIQCPGHEKVFFSPHVVLFQCPSSECGI